MSAGHVTPQHVPLPRYSGGGEKLEEGDVDDAAPAVSSRKPWRIF
jgi:hypothetical protein